MLFAHFNQDFSYLFNTMRLDICQWGCGRAIASRMRLVVADISLLDDEARELVGMLFCTSLKALVGAADQQQSSLRKLQIVNTKELFNRCV
ncbi:uncharacterized protein LACBIDRAFT_304391 [Laccaria bicolor S238N-H82]|uniref:Predicted protein n=1 Tax=Laccaria bicolor (strain S238N-H82 / ATCC MYA-4686) TaxID=486041 RepID=B0DLJ4_LACBS|nr:uncharacterized protein LACBIDRAFT_304391 [Laccaria bicolor S238N-H82]EDR04657.1 predicted protein [Laccaria bicolor S238N-H82]|eukprot:XP_001884829.1 predicted protein [Laccaria bicolor S238N-H82]